MSRPRAIVEQPDGLRYRPDFVSGDEEGLLLTFLETVDFREVVMRGQVARRTVRHYGWDYGYESWALVPAEPLPHALSSLRERSATLAGLEPEALSQTLVSRYPPGAGIGWHRDAPMFGGTIVGVSLHAAARMRFQRSVGGARRTWELKLEPRSAYVLAGAARSAWQHSIPATGELRYSVTFRTVRNPERWRR